MTKLSVLLTITLGSCCLIFLTWLLLHLNGKVIISTFVYFQRKLRSNPETTQGNNYLWFQSPQEVETIILGITPLALSSLVLSSFGTCINPVKVTLIIETIIISLFLVIPNRFKNLGYLFGIHLLNKYKIYFLFAFAWCLLFGVWAVLSWDISPQLNIDRLLINTNPDMWAYIRRFSGLMTSNLSFDGNLACSYFLNSPKKLSSFMGSMILYFSPSITMAITWFQGLLGCSLFLCLFADWMKFKQNQNFLPWQIKLFGIIWGISSPQIFWLLVSSYLSNTLFIIFICLGLRYFKRASLSENDNGESLIILTSLMISVFSFYPIALPLSVFLYRITVIIYSPDLFKRDLIFKEIKNFGFIGIIILLFFLLFRDHFLLEEVQKGINPLIEHGSNIVPLNPWSLLQETPNPMPNRIDFGVWINIIIGLLFSSFCLWKIGQNVKRQKTQIDRNLIAYGCGLFLYIAYLIAHLPLDSTYRLGKVAISFIWPLAIFALIPLSQWLYNQTSRNKTYRLLLIIFVTSHILLHFDYSFSHTPRAYGIFDITAVNFNQFNQIIVMGCSDVHISNRYEIMAGFKLARNHPNLEINVISDQGNESNFAEKITVIKGNSIPINEKNICSYSNAL